MEQSNQQITRRGAAFKRQVSRHRVFPRSWFDRHTQWLKNVLFGSTGPRGGVHEGLAQSAARSAVRSIGSAVGREIIRGVLGSLMGGSRKR